MMGGCPPTHPPWYGLDGLGGSPAPPCGAVGLWCVPGLFRKSDRERIKRERESKRGTERTKRGDRKQAKTSKGAYQKSLKKQRKISLKTNESATEL